MPSIDRPAAGCTPAISRIVGYSAAWKASAKVISDAGIHVADPLGIALAEGSCRAAHILTRNPAQRGSAPRDASANIAFARRRKFRARRSGDAPPRCKYA